VLTLEYILYQAVVFAKVTVSSIAGDHSRSVLASVLQNCQGIINVLLHFILRDNAYNSTHWLLFFTG
jgi:hypothetical protein